MDIEGNLAEIYMPDCCHPEAKTRIILNVLSCLQSRDVVVYIYNNDTDMVFLLSAYEPDFLKLTVMQRLLLNVDLVWDYITCQPIQSLIVSGSKDAELLSLHSLSGCDYISSYSHLDKIRFWDSWLLNTFQTHFLSSVTVQICLWAKMISVLFPCNCLISL